MNDSTAFLADLNVAVAAERMRHLLKLLGGGRFGQVIITDTDAGRLHKALDGLPLETRFFQLDHATVKTGQRTIAEGRA